MVRLPIKVLNIGVDVDEQKGPVDNPFLRKEIKSPSIVEIAMNKIEEISSIRKKRSVYRKLIQQRHKRNV
jgi:hypothetical protein